MEILKENGSSEDTCKLCNTNRRKYTCPRCGIGYCNSNCYKSDAHLECSESFYKQCIEEELKSQEVDPEGRKKMNEILKRMHEQQIEDVLETNGESDEESQLDSDDDNEMPTLEQRLHNVNLDNADDVWAALTDSEKQEFHALLKNGEVDNILPKWVPWWTFCRTKRLIEDAETNELPEYVKYCPTLVDVPTLSELRKASPNLRYNIMNVIYSYAYMAIYYNGDYQNCPDEATRVFLFLCDTMRRNKVFDNMESAIGSVAKNASETDWLPKDEQMMQIFREAGDSILRGPEESAKSFYVSAAISDLYTLFNAAKVEISIQKDKPNNREFSSKFSRWNNNNLNLTKKSLLLYCKKLEYYLAWIKSGDGIN